MDNKSLGYLGEKTALNLLNKKGYSLLQKNYRTKIGEIDIIAIENNCLVFIEVKTRRSNSFVKPLDALTTKKIKKIAQIGELYRSIRPHLPTQTRIDAVLIEMDIKNNIKCNLIQNICFD